MLELNFIRKNNKSIIEHLKVRNKDFRDLILKVLDFDEQRRSAQFKLDNELSELNQLSKEIGEMFKSGQQQAAIKLKEQTILLKDSTKELKQHLVDLENSINEILYQIPNVPNKQVPLEIRSRTMLLLIVMVIYQHFPLMQFLTGKLPKNTI